MFISNLQVTHFFAIKFYLYCTHLRTLSTSQAHCKIRCKTPRTTRKGVKIWAFSRNPTHAFFVREIEERQLVDSHYMRCLLENWVETIMRCSFWWSSVRISWIFSVSFKCSNLTTVKIRLNLAFVNRTLDCFNNNSGPRDVISSVIASLRSAWSKCQRIIILLFFVNGAWWAWNPLQWLLAIVTLKQRKFYYHPVFAQIKNRDKKIKIIEIKISRRSYLRWASRHGGRKLLKIFSSLLFYSAFYRFFGYQREIEMMKNRQLGLPEKTSLEISSLTTILKWR